MTWLWALVPIALGWPVGNVAGWWFTKPGPFNWRVLVHSDLYYKWLDSQETPPVD